MTIVAALRIDRVRGRVIWFHSLIRLVTMMSPVAIDVDTLAGGQQVARTRGFRRGLDSHKLQSIFGRCGNLNDDAARRIRRVIERQLWSLGHKFHHQT